MKAGSLTVVCGPMFAGKTEELIRILRRELWAKRYVMVFKPALDGRYSEHDVVSHNGTTLKARAVPVVQMIRDLVERSGRPVYAIGIDEVQFFDEDVVDVVRWMVRRGIRVTVSGLDLTFDGKPFGQVPSLLAMAEVVRKLTAVCECGADATRSKRLVSSEQEVLVGGEGEYQAVCATCYFSG